MNPCCCATRRLVPLLFALLGDGPPALAGAAADVLAAIVAKRMDASAKLALVRQLGIVPLLARWAGGLPGSFDRVAADGGANGSGAGDAGADGGGGGDSDEEGDSRQPGGSMPNSHSDKLHPYSWRNIAHGTGEAGTLGA